MGSSNKQFYENSIEGDSFVIFLLAFNPYGQTSISERDLKIVESDNTAGCQVFL